MRLRLRPRPAVRVSPYLHPFASSVVLVALPLPASSYRSATFEGLLAKRAGTLVVPPTCNDSHLATTLTPAFAELRSCSTDKTRKQADSMHADALHLLGLVRFAQAELAASHQDISEARGKNRGCWRGISGLSSPTLRLFMKELLLYCALCRLPRKHELR